MVNAMFSGENKKIIVDDALKSRFFPLFRKGIQVEIENGLSLAELFREQWEIPAEYIQQRISSVFLDFHPVDDLENTRVADGMVLALSSAMPGLVGAVMRRGLSLSSLRQSITYSEKTFFTSHHNGIITVKLFNLLVEELSVIFFRMGFRVTIEDARKILPDGISLPEKGYVIIKN